MKKNYPQNETMIECGGGHIHSAVLCLLIGPPGGIRVILLYTFYTKLKLVILIYLLDLMSHFVIVYTILTNLLE